MLVESKRSAHLMGSSFEFRLVAPKEDAELLLDLAVTEVKRLEMLLSEFSDQSETSLINQLAGIRPAKVSDEVFQLISRSLHLSEITQGAFDISASLLKHLYPFKKKSFEPPTQAQVFQALRKVGYQKIKMKAPNSVYLTVPGMRIGFGAIGKGYAADRVMQLLKQKGVESGVINASGDLTAWGRRLSGEPWKVGIADPTQANRILMWLPIDNRCMATSGDYEQFFERDGQRFSHTIDPKTGMPTTGVKSATVVSASAELSDALATAIFIMGPEAGMHLIDQLPDVHGLMVDERNRVFTSKDINLILTDHER